MRIALAVGLIAALVAGAVSIALAISLRGRVDHANDRARRAEARTAVLIRERDALAKRVGKLDTLARKLRDCLPELSTRVDDLDFQLNVDGSAKPGRLSRPCSAFLGGYGPGD